MSYNRKALRVDLGKYYKPNPYKKDIITDPEGQWKYPGQVTRIPGNQITMQGVPYPVYGQDDTGFAQMMYPGEEYEFPGNYVDEIPMAQRGGRMGETGNIWYPTYSPATYHFSNDVNRIGTEFGFENPNIAGKRFANRNGITIPISYTHHEDYGKGFGPALSEEDLGEHSDYSHFGAKDQQRFDELRVGVLGKPLRSNPGGVRGFADVYGGYGAGPYVGTDVGAKWNLKDFGDSHQNHADTTLHLFNTQIGNKYGYADNSKNQLFNPNAAKKSPIGSFTPGVSFNVSHAATNKKLKGLEVGAKGSAKINLANQSASDSVHNTEGSQQKQEEGTFNFNPVIDASVYARYKIPDRRKEDKKRVAEKAAKDKLVFPEVTVPHATREGVDFSRPGQNISQPLWGGRPWNEVEMMPEGILNKSVYNESEREMKVGGIPELPLTAGRKAYHAWGYTNNDFIANRQDGGPTYISDEDMPLGYDALWDTINYDPNDEWQNINNPAWKAHEDYHHKQNMEGRSSTSGLLGQRPNPYVSSDEYIGSYFDRRNLEKEAEKDKMIQDNPSLQFIPRNKLGESIFVDGQPSFLGAEERMYANPNTEEGEARMQEQEFQSGGPQYITSLSPEDEKAFQNFRESLPENLYDDDQSYDLRGYWDSEGRPEQFDYSQPKEDDGYYHAYSINSNTGEYLKSPAHHTFQLAVDEDRKLGYRPLPNVQGRNVVVENQSIASPEKQSFLRNTEGPANYIEAELTPEEIEEYRKGGYVIEELPQAQTGKATYADSMSLYNNALQQKAYYDRLKPWYSKPEVSSGFYTDFKTIKQLEKEHLNRRVLDSEKKDYVKVVNKIKSNKDPNKAYLLDIITGALDYKAPMLEYNANIKPQGEITYSPKNFEAILQSTIPRELQDINNKVDYSNMYGYYRREKPSAFSKSELEKIKNKIKLKATQYGFSEKDVDKLLYLKKMISKSQNVLPGAYTTLPYYDPIAVKPAALLTDAEVKKRVAKYGTSGIPESRLKKLNISGPKPETKPIVDKKTNKVITKTTTLPGKATEDKVKPLTTKPTIDKNAIVQNTKKQLPNKPVEKVDQSRLKPGVYKAQWKQNPVTGTWYQDEVIDLKGDSTVYNPATGGYSKRKYAEGGYIELDLTPEEIQQYKDGGYIVEDISVPTLTRAQEGLEQEVYRNQEVPEVPVVAEAPDWLKFSREYENIKSKDAFVEEKKRKYLKQNKGLNKLAGLSMDNFPKEVENNFANEYEYKKNTYVTRKLGKKEGFNPRHRGDWVDELTPGEQKVVANSKYGSKLQPGAYARTLAGAQELVNALIKREPGRRGDVLRYKIPGLTSREQKEIAESPTGALEIFSAFDAPTGYNVANFLKNRGLSTGSNYKELPGITSGELMPNVSEGEASAFNPFTYYGLVHPSAAILERGYKGMGKAVKKLSKDVVEESPGVAGASFDLTRPARPPKPKKFYDEFEDDGFTVIKKNGTPEKPKDIIIKKGDNHIHAELNKDGTWKFHNKWHDPENPKKGILEAGKAMKMMNKHIPAFPKIRETQSFSPDSYKNIVNLTKHPDWDYKIAGRIPLNNQARVSNLTKDAMENSHASTVVKGKENAQRIVDEINKMLEKKGFTNPLHHKAFYRGLIEDEYEILLPNFELSRKYKQGGALELELTPEEIQAYRDQGYTVEELD